MSLGIVVMGVSGCGKSTLGAALADALGIPFVEGDGLHPPANVAKMAAGIPLNDEDRRPFLDNVADALIANRAAGCVVSCSALKRGYRDRLRARAGADIRFVLPLLSKDSLVRRMSAREGHFMPVQLLDSQLATLEMPDEEEAVIVVPGDLPLDAQLAAVRSALSGETA